MEENSTEGVWYSPDSVPPEGVYANIQDGKEPACVFVAGFIVAVLLSIVLLVL